MCEQRFLETVLWGGDIWGSQLHSVFIHLLIHSNTRWLLGENQTMVRGDKNADHFQKHWYSVLGSSLPRWGHRWKGDRMGQTSGCFWWYCSCLKWDSVVFRQCMSSPTYLQSSNVCVYLCVQKYVPGDRGARMWPRWNMSLGVSGTLLTS